MRAAQESNSKREGGVMGRSYQSRGLKVGWQGRHFPDGAGRTNVREIRWSAAYAAMIRSGLLRLGTEAFGRVGVKDEV